MTPAWQNCPCASEKQGILAAVERGPGCATNPISDLIAHNCAEDGREEKSFQGDRSGSRENAGSDQQRVARKKETDEKSSFDEDDQADKKRSAPSDDAFHVVDVVEKLLDGIEQAVKSLSDPAGSALTATRRAQNR